MNAPIWIAAAAHGLSIPLYAHAMEWLGQNDGRALSNANPPIALNPGRVFRASDVEDVLVETLNLEEIEKYREAWSTLAIHAIEPNVFMEPAFALSAALHAPAASRPNFIAVWQSPGNALTGSFEPRARLIGLCALDPRAHPLVPSISRVWRHKHAALGGLLIDARDRTRAVDALLNWLSSRSRTNAAISIPSIPSDGALFALLKARCAANKFEWRIANVFERACLRADSPLKNAANRQSRRNGQQHACDAAKAKEKAIVSAKHGRELKRQWRRLSELGALTNHSAKTSNDVRAAVEAFLALETMGWKGKRKTDLLSDVGDSAFVRSMTRLLAREGKCRIDWLALNGKPIAMGIVLTSGRRAYFWKTAYDESLAHYSPGVQLTRQLMDRQMADAEIDLSDSCAIPNHPMIDRLWSDKQPIADMLISVGAAKPRVFERIARRERFWRDVRSFVKTATHTAMGRKRSKPANFFVFGRRQALPKQALEPC